jgi:hypothetical protein
LGLLLVLVLVVLAGEGVEELFYEAGHFGRWFVLVLFLVDGSGFEV